jgi:hypothetical protein
MRPLAVLFFLICPESGFSDKPRKKFPTLFECTIAALPPIRIRLSKAGV